MCIKSLYWDIIHVSENPPVWREEFGSFGDIRRVGTAIATIQFQNIFIIRKETPNLIAAIHLIWNLSIFLPVFEHFCVWQVSLLFRPRPRPGLFPLPALCSFHLAHLHFSVSPGPAFCFVFSPVEGISRPGSSVENLQCSLYHRRSLAWIHPQVQAAPALARRGKDPPHTQARTPHPHSYNLGIKHIYWSKRYKPRVFKKHTATCTI